MTSDVPPTGAPIPPPKLDEVGALHALVVAIRTRIISGLVLALPIALTIWIVYSLYATVKQLALDPLTGLLRSALALGGVRLPAWTEAVVIPVVAVVLVLCLLYVLGLFVRSWAHRAIDWVFLHVPVVTTIYKALSNVFDSLARQVQGGSHFQRVVLVEFPHPGMRALAFVTNTLRDARSDKTILCVCVLTGVVPPAGFTLFVPEESVTDIDWSVNQTLQAILSGGITTPAVIRYFEGLPYGAATGPIIDAHGRPIDPHNIAPETVPG